MCWINLEANPGGLAWGVRPMVSLVDQPGGLSLWMSLVVSPWGDSIDTLGVSLGVSLGGQPMELDRYVSQWGQPRGQLCWLALVNSHGYHPVLRIRLGGHSMSHPGWSSQGCQLQGKPRRLAWWVSQGIKPRVSLGGQPLVIARRIPPSPRVSMWGHFTHHPKWASQGHQQGVSQGGQPRGVEPWGVSPGFLLGGGGGLALKVSQGVSQQSQPKRLVQGVYLWF